MAIYISEKTDYTMIMPRRAMDENNPQRSVVGQTDGLEDALHAVTSGSNADQVKTITALKNSSDKLMQAAQSLTVSGKESLFWGISIVSGDDDLKTMSKGQIKDALYKQVSEFVQSYNGVMTSVAKSENTKVRSVAADMQRMTVGDEVALTGVGVMVGNGTKLGISEQALKDAQTETLKKRFEDVAPYLNGIQTEASLIHVYANEDAKKTSGIYTQNALYNSSHASSGYMYNGMI